MRDFTRGAQIVSTVQATYEEILLFTQKQNFLVSSLNCRNYLCPRKSTTHLFLVLTRFAHVDTCYQYVTVTCLVPVLTVPVVLIRTPYGVQWTAVLQNS
jgi:hypothetical protein